ncbi:MAG: hypothetical protein R2873_22760 [Caldilineaceae bacterium]
MLTRDEIVDALHNGAHHIEVALFWQRRIFFNPAAQRRRTADCAGTVERDCGERVVA